MHVPSLEAWYYSCSPFLFGYPGHISRIQQPHMVSGYWIGQCKSRPRGINMSRRCQVCRPNIMSLCGERRGQKGGTRQDLSRFFILPPCEWVVLLRQTTKSFKSDYQSSLDSDKFAFITFRILIMSFLNISQISSLSQLSFRAIKKRVFAST